MNFFKKKINPTNPILKTWIKWFTQPISISRDFLESNHDLKNEFQNLISILPIYHKRDLICQNERTDLEILTETFNIFEPINQSILCFLTHVTLFPDIFNGKEKDFLAIAPVFFRYLSKYSYQFTSIFSQLCQKDDNAQSQVMNFIIFIKFLVITPAHLKNLFSDAKELLNPMFETLNSSFSSISKFEDFKFIDDLYSQYILTLSDLFYHCLQVHENDLLFLIVSFFGKYYQYWCLSFANSDFKIQHLDSCLIILNNFLSLPPTFIQNNFQFIDTQLNAGFNCLSFYSITNHPDFPKDDLFSMGIQFLKFFIIVSDSVSGTKNDLWARSSSFSPAFEMLHFASIFNIWTIDNFPFHIPNFPKSVNIIKSKEGAAPSIPESLFQTRPMMKNPKIYPPEQQYEIHEYNVPDDIQEIKLMKKSLPKIIPPISEFITFSTFSNPIYSTQNQKFISYSDFDEYSNFSPEPITNIISNNEKIKDLLDIYINLTHFPNSQKFVEKFVLTTLAYVEPAYQKESKSMESNPVYLSTSILCFVLHFLNLIDKKLVSEALLFNSQTLSIFFMSPIFRVNNFLYSQDFKFFKSIRRYFYYLLEKLFISDSIMASHILNTFSIYLENATPEMFDEPLQFLIAIQYEDPELFANAFLMKNNEKFRNQLLEKLINFQQLQLSFKDEQDSFFSHISNTRWLLFQVIDGIIRNMPIRVTLFRWNITVSTFFHFLYEKDVQDFAISLICRGLSMDIDQCDESLEKIFSQLSNLLNTLNRSIDSINYIQLAHNFLPALANVFTVNRTSLISYIDRFEILKLLAKIPVISSDERNRNDFIDLVLLCFIPITKGHPESQKLIKEPLSNIIKDNVYQFQRSSLQLMLELCFEQVNSLQIFDSLEQSHLEVYQQEIRNQKVLSFIHQATSNLNVFHSNFFKYLTAISKNSINNKLQIYHSDLPRTILKYVQTFDRITPSTLEHLSPMLDLFNTVSISAFKWQTLFEALKAMRGTKVNGVPCRNWWTGQFISCFHKILVEQNEIQSHNNMPTSFFHFDGRHSGIFLPKIKGECFPTSSLTFHTRFELDSQSSLPGLKACLLSLKSKKKDSKFIGFDILLDNRKLFINSKDHEYDINFEFQTGHWYDFSFVYNSNISTATIYVDGEIIHQIQHLKMKFSIESYINGAICNTSYSTLKTELPLICNMTCVHMFNQFIDPITIKSIAQLPIDFIYPFTHVSALMYPELKSIIDGPSSEIIQNNLIFCYNARMCNGKNCINAAISNIDNSNSQRELPENAQTFGQRISFSTSFCSVVENVGGVSLFLPLFEQVDFPIFQELVPDDSSETSPEMKAILEKQKSSYFLGQLIDLLAAFLKRSEMIQTTFLTSDLLKALAFLLSKVGAQSITLDTIMKLLSIYESINSDVGKIKMLKDFWLNTALWETRPDDIQKYMISMILKTEAQHLLPAATTVGELALIAMRESKSKLRDCWWLIALDVAKQSFNDTDQEFFIKLGNDSIDDKIKFEALRLFLALFDNKIQNCQNSILKFGLYHPFINLCSSNSEEIRIIGMNFIIKIFKYISTGVIQQPNGSLTFPQTIIAVISVFNSSNCSNSFWEILIGQFFQNKGFMSALFPLISFISPQYPPEVVFNFITRLNDLLEFPNDKTKINTLSETFQIANCACWEFWLFFILLQCSNVPFSLVSFEKNSFIDVVFSIYAKIIVFFLLMQKIDGAQEAINFLYLLEFIKFNGLHLNLSEIFRNVFIKIIQMCKIFINELNINFIIQEVLTYLFYIPTFDPFSSNYQLLQKYNQSIPQVLQDTISGPISLNDLRMKFLEVNIQKDDFSMNFSMRVNENGKWIDSTLASTLCEYIFMSSDEKSIFNSDSIVIFTDNKFKLYDIGVILLGFLSRSLRNRTYLLQKCTLNETQVYLLSSQLNYVQFPADIFETYETYLVKENWEETSQNLFSSYLQNFQELSSKQSEFFKIKIDSIVNTVKKQFIFFSPFPISLPNNSERFLLFNAEQTRLKSINEKAYKTFWVDLVSNNGPWTKEGGPKHWKLSQHYDAFFRRVYLKPNLNFNLHKKASLIRDEGTLDDANRKYTEWLLQHPHEEEEEGFAENDNPESNPNLEIIKNQKSVPKDSLTVPSTLITVVAKHEGTFTISPTEVVFSCATTEKVSSFSLEDIIMVLHRSYLHVDCGLEFFLLQRKSHLFIFSSKEDRKRIINRIKKLPTPNLQWLQEGSAREILSQMKLTEQWINGNISNYQYLMYLNFIGGRSFNDMSQYPVFPWILKNYTSETIDLNDPENYRDLSKPIGALNEIGLQNAREKFEFMESIQQPNAAFWYTHYSNPYYLGLYLLRLEPFASLHIEMQDGKFDKTNRMFGSIIKTWETASSKLPDYRELIPEFFTLPNFLVNENNFDLGVNPDTDKKLDSVELPRWASSPEAFIAIHREALESPYVSAHLNEWIDLIFGSKQNGEGAKAAFNLFHPSCYESSLTPEIMKDPEALKILQDNAENFGIVPHQLFLKPHPTRCARFNLPRLSPQGLSGLHLCWHSDSQPIKLYSHPIISFIIMYTKSGGVIMLSPSLEDGDDSLIPHRIATVNQTVISQNNFAILSDQQIYVASSETDNAFYIYSYKDGESTYLGVGQQKHALVTKLISTRNLVLSCWNDSSLVLFDVAQFKLQESSTKLAKPLYRAAPHRSSLIDVDTSVALNLIASVDKSRQIILSLLRSGRFLRGVKIDDDENDQIQKIIIDDAGYIAVLSHSKDLVMRVYGLDCKMIGKKIFENAKMTCICKTRLPFGIAGFVIGFENGRIVLIKLPSLMIGLDVVCEDIPNNICFSPSLMKIFVSSENGNVYYITVQ